MKYSVKDASTVEKFAEKLTQKCENCDEIKSVTSDMSAAFLSAVENKFPNAKHTIDKFHVKQLLLKSLDEVRKKEQKESSEKQALFRGRKGCDFVIVFCRFDKTFSNNRIIAKLH